MKYMGNGEYQLDTGRKLSANHGILGLKPKEVGSWDSRLSEGYDSYLSQGKADEDPDYEKDWLEENPELKRLTTEERTEIALFQIKLWSEWAGFKVTSDI